jgi:hypothetical protein
MRAPTTCRVCRLEFTASRFDAITCSSTCRQRLKRGHAFAYLTGLPKHVQRAEREMHAAFDKFLVAYRDDIAAKHRVRELNRERRRQKQEQERERI